MQTNQITGSLDRIVLVGVTYLVMGPLKNYIPESAIPDICTLVLTAGGVAYAIYRNRPVATVKAAAEIPGTTIVTTAALAEATPAQANIVSNVDQKVVNK